MWDVAIYLLLTCTCCETNAIIPSCSLVMIIARLHYWNRHHHYSHHHDMIEYMCMQLKAPAQPQHLHIKLCFFLNSANCIVWLTMDHLSDCRVVVFLPNIEILSVGQWSYIRKDSRGFFKCKHNLENLTDGMKLFFWIFEDILFTARPFWSCHLVSGATLY